MKLSGVLYICSENGQGVEGRDGAKYVFVFVFMFTNAATSIFVFVFVFRNVKSCIFVFVHVFARHICLKYIQMK